jgi:hypothetical protein
MKIKPRPRTGNPCPNRLQKRTPQCPILASHCTKTGQLGMGRAQAFLRIGRLQELCAGPLTVGTIAQSREKYGRRCRTKKDWFFGT